MSICSESLTKTLWARHHRRPNYSIRLFENGLGHFGLELMGRLQVTGLVRDKANTKKLKFL